MITDLDGFFTGLDAKDVTVVLADGTRRTFKAYFDAPYLEPRLEDFAVETAAYKLTCQARDVAGVTRKSTAVWVDGAEYAVSAVRPDGTGIVEVMLDATCDVTVQVDW